MWAPSMETRWAGVGSGGRYGGGVETAKKPGVSAIDLFFEDTQKAVENWKAWSHYVGGRAA